tara:strand:+ start:697 stop:1962 length:1266 start_codon:yes stop_codon:yes gene_type:complete
LKTQLGAKTMLEDQKKETEVVEEQTSGNQIDEAPVEELDEAPAGVQDLGGDNPDTGKANKLEAGTKKAPARKADKSGGDSSQPTQGNSVKPAVSEDKVSNSKNGMVAQVYEMLKNMSKEELGEKFGLIQDIVELDVEKMEEDSDPAIAEAQEKILYSRKDLTSDEIELDTEADIQAIAGEDLSEEFKEKAKEIFESAVKSKVVEEVNKRVSQIEEEYLQEIEESTKTFQNEMVEKVDNYLNYVVSEWMEDNKLAVEKGIKTELTDDFMNGLRNLFKEHYIDIPEEKVDIVDDLFDKVEDLEVKLNEEIDKNIKLKQSLAEAKKDEILNDVCDDLADTQKEKISSLSEGVEFDSEEQYKAKLNLLKESYFPTKAAVVSEDVVEETTSTTEEINEEIENIQEEARDSQMKAYLDMLSRTTNNK